MPAIDFSKLLKRPAGQAKPQTPLPIGDYPAILKSWEPGTSQNGNSYIRFHVGLTGWPEGFSESETMYEGPGGQMVPIDLSKRQLRRDFFLTDDALVMLDNFLRTLGFEDELANGAEYEVLLPQTIGKAVTAEVQQFTSQRTGRTGNQINSLIGQDAPDATQV
jgi:hypothetical protein